MAFKDTYFTCVDNTGVRFVKCLKVYSTKIVVPGSIILVTIKDVLPHRKVTKGQMYKCVVVRLKKTYLRFYHFGIKYFSNSVIVLKKNELVPLGTRIFGSVYFEVRLKGFMKIVSLSAFLL